MKKDTATAILRSLQQLDPAFEELTSLTYQIDNEEERKAIRRHLAEAMRLLGYELTMHIVRQYPDLDPDK